jgi:hypothetical protein
MPDDINDVQAAFLVYAAIKRAINVTARTKSASTFAVGYLAPLTRRLVGMSSSSKDCIVSTICIVLYTAMYSNTHL